jgi:hypothetical protein
MTDATSVPTIGAQPKTDVPSLPVVAPGIEHKPTRRMRRLVEGMVASGVTRASVAQMLEMSEETLNKHYRQELETGSDKAVALLSRSLYRRAMKGDTTAAIFWLKARGRWRDRDAMNVTVEAPSQADTPKLDSRQVEDAIYVALARLRPTSLKAADAKLLIHKE